MRFTHTADCHIGGHRDVRLKALTEQAFQQYVDETIAHKVDFTIIAGDLFNTAIPGIDTLKFTVAQLNKLKQATIPVYAIPGSHDYSPSGKTMLDVLEEAGLLINVCQGTINDQNKLTLTFTKDEKTGVKLTGVIGKRGMLDRHIYEELDQSIEKEQGTKIFLFHTAISELKAEDLAQMESYPLSFLPKNFDYYAGGHVHIVEHYEEPHYKNVIYPGPLFPNSFSELEKLQHGGYYVYDNGVVSYRPIMLRKVTPVTIDVDQKTLPQAQEILHKIIDEIDANDAIILLRIGGMLESGSVSQLRLQESIEKLEAKGAYIVLRNTSQLQTKEFDSVHLASNERTPHALQEALLREHAAQLKLGDIDMTRITSDLLQTLCIEPLEGEKVADHQERTMKAGLAIIDALSPMTRSPPNNKP